MYTRTGRVVRHLFDLIGNKYPFPFSLQVKMNNIISALETLNDPAVDLSTLRNKEGYTLLICAVRTNEFKIVDLLLSHGIHPDSVDAKNMTALEYALDSYKQITQRLDILRPQIKYLSKVYRNTENKTEDPTVTLESEAVNLLKRQKIQLSIVVRLIEAGASNLNLKKHSDLFTCLNEQPFTFENAKILLCSGLIRGVEARVYQEKFNTLHHEIFSFMITRLSHFPNVIAQLISEYTGGIIDFSFEKSKSYQGKFFDNNTARIDFALERLKEEMSGVPKKKSKTCSIM